MGGVSDGSWLVECLNTRAHACVIHPSIVRQVRARARSDARDGVHSCGRRARTIWADDRGSRRRESRAVVRDEDDEEAAGTVGVETRWARGDDVSRVVVDSRVVVVVVVVTVSRVVGRGGGVR